MYDMFKFQLDIGPGVLIKTQRVNGSGPHREMSLDFLIGTLGSRIMLEKKTVWNYVYLCRRKHGMIFLAKQNLSSFVSVYLIEFFLKIRLRSEKENY